MPPLPNLLGFAAAAFALIAVPGPSVLFTIGRTLALGRRGGILTVVGNTLGQVPLIAATALGVGVLVAESVVAFTALKLAGAAYLVYLGVQAIRSRGHGPLAHRFEGIAPTGSLRQMAEGFVVGVTNPKSIAFFVAVLPQFVARDVGSVPLQMLVLGLVFVVLALLSDTAWALAAGAARAWFARSPKRSDRMAVGGGVVMIGLGVALAASGSKS